MLATVLVKNHTMPNIYFAATLLINAADVTTKPHVAKYVLGNDRKTFGPLNFPIKAVCLLFLQGTKPPYLTGLTTERSKTVVSFSHENAKIDFVLT